LVFVKKSRRIAAGVNDIFGGVKGEQPANLEVEVRELVASAQVEGISINQGNTGIGQGLAGMLIGQPTPHRGRAGPWRKP
jgi:hypothetical protein